MVLKMKAALILSLGLLVLLQICSAESAVKSGKYVDHYPQAIGNSNANEYDDSDSEGGLLGIMQLEDEYPDDVASLLGNDDDDLTGDVAFSAGQIIYIIMILILNCCMSILFTPVLNKLTHRIQPSDRTYEGSDGSYAVSDTNSED